MPTENLQVVVGRQLVFLQEVLVEHPAGISRVSGRAMVNPATERGVLGDAELFVEILRQVVGHAAAEVGNPRVKTRKHASGE
ncbi:MAG: hypothetical protein ACKOFW_09580, partial [Planctomycetaceae bacterium]